MGRKAKLKKLKKQFPYEYQITKKWHKIFKDLNKEKKKNGGSYLNLIQIPTLLEGLISKFPPPKK